MAFLDALSSFYTESPWRNGLNDGLADYVTNIMTALYVLQMTGTDDTCTGQLLKNVGFIDDLRDVLRKTTDDDTSAAIRQLFRMMAKEYPCVVTMVQRPCLKCFQSH